MAFAMPVEPDIGAFPREGTLRITIPGDALAVRDGLKAIFASSLLASLSAEARSTVEIVLAEALNNIVEHAYARHPGEIEMTLSLCQGGLLCRITDTGLPMPGGQLPQGALAPFLETDPPEGGFGWFLIRSLSRDLSYQRNGAQNLLSFRLNAKQ